MDHLLRPRDPVERNIAVPFLGDSYDNGQFLTYPDRAGERWRHFTSDRRSFFENQKSTDPIALAKFLQAWLFFGLLHELLQPWGLYNPADYIDDQIIHTRRLNERLGAWCDKVHDLNEDAKIEIGQRMSEPLELVKDVLRALLESNFDSRIRWSLAVLFDTVNSVLALEIQVWQMDFAGDDTINFCPEDIDCMLEHHWCPAVLRSKRKEQLSSVEKWYLTCMRQSGHHDLCRDLCMYEETGNDYQPAHASCDGCDAVRPDLDAVANILQSGSFPVMAISSDGEIQRVPYSNGVRYVALSHVWAEGLGNPKELALPRCQLKRIRKLVNAIEDGIHVWCDSLLCPMDPVDKEKVAVDPGSTVPADTISIKQLAMSRMRKVYQDSTYTLVLANGLNISTEGMRPIEMAWRVITCNWYRRLWTVQEAALPARLMYQFSDRAVSHVQVYGDSLSSRGSTRHDLSSLPLTIRSSRQSANFVRLSLDDIPRLLTHRHGKHAEDESLCAATLLGLDVGRVWKQTGVNNRMIAFWTECVGIGIPQDIIFNGFARIDRPGFRWAPCTFRTDVPKALSVDGARHGALTSTGLLVHMCAWKVEVAAWPYVYPLMYPRPRTVSAAVGLQGPDGHYELIFTQEQAELLSSSDSKWYVIYHDDEFGRRALLGILTDGVFRGASIGIRKDDYGIRQAAFELAMKFRATNKKYLKCWLINTIGQRLFVPLRQNSLLWYWMTISGVILRHHVRYFMQGVEKLGSLPASSRLEWAFEKTGWDMGLVQVLAHRMFHGQHVKVVKTFDEDTSWCID